MSYHEAIRLATFIAPSGIDEYTRSTVESLCEDVGCETARDFFEAYERRFGIGMRKQIAYAVDWEMQEALQ